MEGSPFRAGSRSHATRSFVRAMSKMELQRKWSLGLPVEAKSGEDLRRHCLLKAAKAALMVSAAQFTLNHVW